MQQYPKPTRLIGRKKMLIALSKGRAIFVEMENCMDHLLQCAKNFERLTHFQYRIIIGRKGRTIELNITFSVTDFHHLAGLHKLVDISKVNVGKRETLFRTILSGEIGEDLLMRSCHYSKMRARLYSLRNLEQFLDSNELIFRFDRKKVKGASSIRADFLLQNDLEGMTAYLFIAPRRENDTQVCVSFFPKGRTDYAYKQEKFTLLYKEKQDLRTGKIVVQYDKLTWRRNTELPSEQTLEGMDRAIANLERGKVSEPVDLSDFESKT